jgi:putative FmdB family regulatory protein
VPTYQYACTACDERLDVVQKFSDDPLTECGECGGRLRKVFSAAGIIFKGSGFYRTDSRGSGKAPSTTSSSGSDKPTKSESSSDSKSSDSKSSGSKSSGDSSGSSASSSSSSSSSSEKVA